MVPVEDVLDQSSDVHWPHMKVLCLKQLRAKFKTDQYRKTPMSPGTILG
jgi:hypothetical protein